MNVDPIDDSEVVLRRIPIAQRWYDEGTGIVERLAFNPNAEDLTGISLTRERYLSSRELAERGRSPKGYYVAALRVGDLRSGGMTIVPKPLVDNIGHAELSDLTYQNRRDKRSVELMHALADKVIRVDGPYVPDRASDSG